MLLGESDLRHDVVITTIKVGKGCFGTLEDHLHPTDENAVASGGNRLINDACKNRCPVDLGDSASGIRQVDALKPVACNVIIAPCEPICQIGPVVRQHVDAERPVRCDGFGDPAACA